MTAIEQTEKYSGRGREERKTEIGKGLEAQTAVTEKNTLVNNTTADSLFVT